MHDITEPARNAKPRRPTIPQGRLKKAEHLKLLKRAIAANLAARTDHDLRQNEANKDRPVKFKIFCEADLMGADENRLFLDSVIKDPVRRALRKQLKDLGQRLYNVLGTTDGMVEIAQEIADLEPSRRGYRINIIDKAWDGVGKDDDRWWA